LWYCRLESVGLSWMRACVKTQRWPSQSRKESLLHCLFKERQPFIWERLGSEWWLVMGPGQKFLTRVGSGRVSHLWFGLEFGKFPLKTSNFSIFYPSGQKNCFGSGRKVPGSKPGRPLIYCGSKVSSGRVGSGPISSGDQWGWSVYLERKCYLDIKRCRNEDQLWNRLELSLMEMCQKSNIYVKIL